MTLILLENDCLRVLIAPEIGGRVVSLIDRETGREFLWRNPALQLGRSPPGTSYDPNFYGGIDELLPCALPETIYGVVCPDHSEL